MKQEIKKLGFLFFMMSLFTLSHEKACVGNEKCVAAPIDMEKNSNNNGTANTDSELPIMPISKFILLQ